MKLSLLVGSPPSSGPLVEAHRKLREPRAVAVLIAGALAVALVPLIPGVSARLEVTLHDTALAMGVFAIVSLAAAVVFWRRGATPAYWWLCALETLTTALTLLSLVWASGNPLSPFWLLFVCLSLIVAVDANGRIIEGLAFVVAPQVLALLFLLEGEPAKAAISAVIGGVVVVLGTLLRGLFVGLTEARNERDRLRAELAELRLREERHRISRDLHDGLGTELASLTWTARMLHQRLEGSPVQSEVGQLLERLRSGMDELRTVVWALRAPARPWEDVVARLAQRCRELGGDRDVVVEASAADPRVEFDGQVALDLVRAVQELVHNAARHAQPRRIRVTLRCDPDGIRFLVEDDGRGLADGALEQSEGGLKNFRTRVESAGGTTQVESSSQGTRVSAWLPAPTFRPNIPMQ
ncbi:sensor histidine kinase [Archangium lansingense]|uniref:Sensor histidine kinase n=1 Tax=Archangium lansingense TaxID=2995310 RepID=A0ABT4AB94_9BACT|nr:sensor histidine kinase [Archangium lansinium]MCY1078945.1 sensor histidine kinase [Archangium lansinium]